MSNCCRNKPFQKGHQRQKLQVVTFFKDVCKWTIENSLASQKENPFDVMIPSKRMNIKREAYRRLLLTPLHNISHENLEPRVAQLSHSSSRTHEWSLPSEAWLVGIDKRVTIHVHIQASPSQSDISPDLLAQLTTWPTFQHPHAPFIDQDWVSSTIWRPNDPALIPLTTVPPNHLFAWQRF